MCASPRSRSGERTVAQPTTPLAPLTGHHGFVRAVQRLSSRFDGLGDVNGPRDVLFPSPSAVDDAVDSVCALREAAEQQADAVGCRSAVARGDTQRVPNDGVDGWTFDPDTTVTLTVHGSYCDKLILNGNRVDLVAGCPSQHN